MHTCYPSIAGKKRAFFYQRNLRQCPFAPYQFLCHIHQEFRNIIDNVKNPIRFINHKYEKKKPAYVISKWENEITMIIF